ncbi:MAG: aldo/keto reductase [Burkholderiales bacterium]|jgi:aryl-alcohol dehydrogenase-like predicted oxidoreductase|nr:aldo/keto reductase [Burkholderiales bacterium]
MQKRRLGRDGPEVPALGLGCMGMSISYGEPDDPESIATMHRAFELGCNLLVTSDAYGSGVNESLIAQAIKGRREEVLIATKFGNLGLAARGGGDAPALSGGHPDYVPQACEASLKRLGVDVIDIYGLHRVDPAVPIEDTVGAMKRLVEQGKVRYLALSEAGEQTLRRAQAVHPIAAVETEYSLWSRDVEDRILPTCRELGIGYMAYAPLGRGFLTATIKSVDALIAKDRRREHPRFLPENINKNNRLLESLESIASAHKATAAQVALAWLLAQGPDIVPIPGTKRRRYLEENLAAAELQLSAAELAQLSAAFPPGVTAGTRYPEKQLKALGI